MYLQCIYYVFTMYLLYIYSVFISLKSSHTFRSGDFAGQDSGDGCFANFLPANQQNCDVCRVYHDVLVVGEVKMDGHGSFLHDVSWWVDQRVVIDHQRSSARVHGAELDEWMNE